MNPFKKLRRDRKLRKAMEARKKYMTLLIPDKLEDVQYFNFSGKDYAFDKATGKTSIGYSMGGQDAGKEQLEAQEETYINASGGSPFLEELQGLNTMYFDRHIHMITKNLATGGWETQIPPNWVTVRVYDLYDEEKNIELVKIKIALTTKLLKQGYKVFVQCAAGINRSNSIATSSLVMMNGNKDTDFIHICKEWNKAYELVQRKVDIAWAHQTLINTCCKAIRDLRGWQHERKQK